MNVGLIGYGRLGKLIAKYIGRDFNLKIYDQQDIESSSSLNEVINSKIIILSVPISEIENVLKKIAPEVKENTLIVDTCSVKEWPIEKMLQYLPQNVSILGTHPMFGPDSVKDTLFGTKLVICPVRIEQEKIDSISHYLTNQGIHLIETTPEEHDRQISTSLFLSHFIGKGLLEFGATEQKIDTKGHRRLLRILGTVENDSDQLFKDMNKYNRFSKQAVNKFLGSLNNVSQFIGD